MRRPYIVLPAQEIPGRGQVHDHILQDAATEAEYALETQGAHAALAYVPRLREMVALKTWRSAAAYDVLQRIYRLLELQTIDLEVNLSAT